MVKHLQLRFLTSAATLLLSFVSLWAQIPNNYYNTTIGKQGDVLKSTLHTITNRELSTLRYSQMWWGYYVTDRWDDDRVADLYSDIKRYYGNRGNSVSGMNREHSVPKSWWKGVETDQAWNDLHHLRPSDAAANSAKLNYPPGKIVGAVTYDNGVFRVGLDRFNKKVFEMADKYKGDMARSYLYMFTCYKQLPWNYDTLFSSGGLPNQWFIDLLVEWNDIDPVDDWERNRNEEVFAIQRSRNPYIDQPSFVQKTWKESSGDAPEWEEDQLRAVIVNGYITIEALPSSSYIYVYRPDGTLVQRELMKAGMDTTFQLKEQGILLVWAYSSKLRMWAKVLNVPRP